MSSTDAQHDWQPGDPVWVIGQPLNQAWVVDRVITGSNRRMVEVVHWEPFEGRLLRMTLREGPHFS